jgi:hypothetical protein
VNYFRNAQAGCLCHYCQKQRESFPLKFLDIARTLLQKFFSTFMTGFGLQYNWLFNPSATAQPRNRATAQ